MGGESWVANNHQTCHPSCNTTTSAAPRISSSRGIWPQIKRSRPEPRMKSRRTRGRYVPELRPTIIYTRGVRKVHIQRAILKICFPRFSIKKKRRVRQIIPIFPSFSLTERSSHFSLNSNLENAIGTYSFASCKFANIKRLSRCFSRRQRERFQGFGLNFSI